MKRIAVLTTLFMLALVSTSLGQITLKGRVIDAKSGKALIGANVRLIGTSIGIATNNKGEFILEKVPEGAYTLRASYSGYEVSSMNIISSKSDIHILLREKQVASVQTEIIADQLGSGCCIRNWNSQKVERFSRTR